MLYNFYGMSSLNYLNIFSDNINWLGWEVSLILEVDHKQIVYSYSKLGLVK